MREENVHRPSIYSHNSPEEKSSNWSQSKHDEACVADIATAKHNEKLLFNQRQEGNWNCNQLNAKQEHIFFEQEYFLCRTKITRHRTKANLMSLIGIYQPHTRHKPNPQNLWIDLRDHLHLPHLPTYRWFFISLTRSITLPPSRDLEGKQRFSNYIRHV